MSSNARLAPWHIVLVLTLMAATAAILLAMGRVPICPCGTVSLWNGAVDSPENSQQLSDWYSPSHLIHGFLFFALFRWVARGQPMGVRLAMAVALEAAWEILENSQLVISRYRAATIALDYTGDSVLNSMSDIGFMMLGFFLAARLPVWLTVTIALFFEIFAAVMVRDNLTLNVLMLVWPLQAVKDWQGAL